MSLINFLCPCERYLTGRIPEDTMRFATFKQSLQLLEERKCKVLVETGTSRGGKSNCLGDGCATLIFGDWAKDHQAHLFSVDISAQNLANAAAALGNADSSVSLVESDSVAFLSSFSGQIDFLYLDSYDYEYRNPDPSQQHHLKEIQAAYPHLTENSIVMIDDCDLPGGGKGKLVIDFLQEKGWKVIARAYQVIMIYLPAGT